MNSITDKEKLLTLVKLRIKNTELSKAVIELMTQEPDHYFWTVPASSSGKYHPSYALGEGGLVRHTIAAMLIAEDLLEISRLQSDDEQDAVYAALALHDFCKQGKSSKGNTIFEHPLVAAELWLEYAYSKNNLDNNLVDTIAGCIRSHMGKWNTNKYSKFELPVPVTRIQKFVHICDYLASRKRLDVDMTLSL